MIVIPTPDENITQELDHEVNWRTDEISALKTILYLPHLSPLQKHVAQKMAIPSFYSLWEGFVIKSLSIYVREINNLNLSHDQICTNILVHSIDLHCNLRDARFEFEKQITFVTNISTHLNGNVQIPVKFPTESNINYRVTNNLLNRFNLTLLPQIPYSKSLDKLLLFRNKIAHGEDSIPINQIIIDEMSNTVISAMHEVANVVLEGYKNKTYLKI